MCFFAYVCVFWLLPLTHDDSFSYLAVVLQVHIVIPLTVVFVGAFGYAAHRVIGLWIL
jgi:hypothetical protein